MQHLGSYRTQYAAAWDVTADGLNGNHPTGIFIPSGFLIASYIIWTQDIFGAALNWGVDFVQSGNSLFGGPSLQAGFFPANAIFIAGQPAAALFPPSDGTELIIVTSLDPIVGKVRIIVESLAAF